MLRRCLPWRTIGVFPLHLDPPNLDHHRVFTQILADPSLGLTKLVLLPLTHSSVTLAKSLHLAAMSGLALREFTPAPAPANGGEARRQSPALIFAAAEEELQVAKDSFFTSVGVNAIVKAPTIAAHSNHQHQHHLHHHPPQPSATATVAAATAAPSTEKRVRVEVNFTALEMHEEGRASVVESLLRDHNNAGGEGAMLFQWLSDVEFGGCLADRLWPQLSGVAPALPLSVLVPTGPMYPPEHHPANDHIISRIAGRWHGPVSVVCVRREWSSGHVRRILFNEHERCDRFVSGPILRYIDSHNLYRDERRQQKRHVAAVNANAMRMPLVSFDVKSDNYTSGSAGGGGGGGGGGVGVGVDGSGDPSTSPARSHKNADVRNPKWVSYAGSIPKLELHYDPRNALARHIYEQLKTFQVRPGEEPDLIVPIGGDGYLMKCVRKFWPRFVPFFGVNAGHVGFLLNDAGMLEEFFNAPLRLYQVGMLYCVAENLLPDKGMTTPLFTKAPSGSSATAAASPSSSVDWGCASGVTPMACDSRADRDTVRAFAFNDAWLERSTGQTAKFRICVNNVERSRTVRGDGVLVSTAAGSTAYAQALGGSPLPIDTPILQLVGSNCTWPVRWRPVHLPEDVVIELESCDTAKRPCRAYVDSVDLGLVRRMTIRMSRVAGVQLAFTRSNDVQAKLYKMQFPDH